MQCVNCNHSLMDHYGDTGQCGMEGCSCLDSNALILENRLSRQGVNIGLIVEECYRRSFKAGWYHSPETEEPLKRNIPEMLCLIHSEISEALEGYRKNLMDDKLPHRKMIEVELADTLIRIADLAGYLNLDLGAAYVEKLIYNETRADHKLENRAQDGGKKF